jgi:hypothetical protein
MLDHEPTGFEDSRMGHGAFDHHTDALSEHLRWSPGAMDRDFFDPIGHCKFELRIIWVPIHGAVFDHTAEANGGTDALVSSGDQLCWVPVVDEVLTDVAKGYESQGGTRNKEGTCEEHSAASCDIVLCYIAHWARSRKWSEIPYRTSPAHVMPYTAHTNSQPPWIIPVISVLHGQRSRWSRKIRAIKFQGQLGHSKSPAPHHKGGA